MNRSVTHYYDERMEALDEKDGDAVMTKEALTIQRIMRGLIARRRVCMRLSQLKRFQQHKAAARLQVVYKKTLRQRAKKAAKGDRVVCKMYCETEQAYYMMIQFFRLRAFCAVWPCFSL